MIILISSRCVKQHIINEESIDYISCNDLTEAGLQTGERLMHTAA